MEERKKNQITQHNNQYYVQLLHTNYRRQKEISINIPKKHPVIIFWMFFGCFEHPIISEIQIYIGYVFEKKEATFHRTVQIEK